ncbi:MAG: hypothetical protein DA328_02525 [Nitrososphaeraceae archaeon]|nr:hypothetical protein [Nitrososphaeraceae archaeon]
MNEIDCGCRCIKCKNQKLSNMSFIASDGYEDIHHTCLSCNTHFNHMDGEILDSCEICRYRV